MNRMPLSLHSIAVASRRRTLLSRVPKAPRVRTNGGVALHGLFTQRFRLRLPRRQRRQFTVFPYHSPGESAWLKSRFFRGICRRSSYRMS